MPGDPFHICIKNYAGERHVMNVLILVRSPSAPGEFAYILTHYANSMKPERPEANALKTAAVRHQIRIVICVSERDHGTLYMAQWIISGG
jgi:hypothetical protein